MEFFWIPEDIKSLISTYFKRTYVRFSNNKYSTNWQMLNIGIMMGSVIAPLLFVLEMILRCGYVNTNQITGHSMKAFMDDVTLIAESRSLMEQLVTRLQELFKWAAMKIKPSKCRSLSFLKGNCKEIKFSVNGNEIHTTRKKALRVLVAATPYHLLIDIVGRTEENSNKMDYAALINATSWTKIKYRVFILD